MLLELLGHKVLLCDMEFLLGCVAWELDDLHTVKERSGDSGNVIGCSYEYALAQVKGHLDEVVSERIVLLTVKDLQHS